MEEKIEVALLKQQMDTIQKKVEDGFRNIESSLKENSLQHEEMFKKFELAMEKKAGRWVENFVVGFITLCLIAFLSYVFYKVFGLTLISN